MNSANEHVPPTGSQEETAVGGKLPLMYRIRRRMRRRRADVALKDIAVIEASGQFDKQWYLQHNPDVASSGMDPIQHYVRHGAAEGRNPVEGFSTAYYLQHNPDVAASGVNPFRHYVEHGRSEGRTSQQQPLHRDHAAAIDDAQIIARSSLFDPGYYLNSNPDVAASGMNPLVHFCQYGFRELRNPSRHFDVGWYWLTYLSDDIDANPLAHYLRNFVRDNLEIRPAGRLSKEDGQSLCDAAIRLLAPDHQVLPANTYQRIGIILERQRRWADAEAAFSRVLALEWSNARVHARMATVLVKQGKWWQAVESWSAATNLDSSRASWFFHLGEAQEKMNRFAPAAEAYQRAINLEPDHPGWYYLLGYMHEKAGHRQLATAAYTEAITRDPREDVKAFGVGVFHQARGYWPQAVDAYVQKLNDNPDFAELHFKLGMAYDRCYQWDNALAAYREAIKLDPFRTYWHYRRGFVLERLERWNDAADAYAVAAMLSTKPMPYWHYRCGYVLAQAGRFKDACQAYVRTCEQRTSSTMICDTSRVSQAGDGLAAFFTRSMVPTEESISRLLADDMTNANLHYLLGEVRERREDWVGAAAAYADAVARSGPHRPGWYYRLGAVLFRLGRFQEACNAFRETRILRRPHGISEAAFEKAAAIVKTSTAYVEYFETLDLREEVILYESFTGSSATCNPLALFERLVDDSVYSKYLHVWVLDDALRMPRQYRELTSVVCVSRGSDGYLRYLCTAKYLINNSGFPPYFIRKKGQRYLATWHGTPLKTLGKEQKYKFYDHKRTQRNFLQATHIISPNSFTTGILLDSYDIRTVFTGMLAETGYPRIDQTLNVSDTRRAELRQQLGISGTRPLVLYAPTWRGTLQNVEFDTKRLEDDIQRLSQRDCDIVFRGHSLMEQVMEGATIGCTIVPPAINTNELLSIIDVLITDYSSTFFDFLATGRPIIYYVYDQEAYEEERGLYFSIDEMPGFKCRDIESLERALDKALNGQIQDKEHLARSQRRFNCHDDGFATERVINFFFYDNKTYVVDPGPRDRCSVLINGGSFQPNGITTSFLNLVNSINLNKIHLTVGFSPNPIEIDPAKMDHFKRMSKAVAAVPRYGSMVMSWEERWLRARHETGKGVDTPEARQLLVNAFDREFNRIFGGGKFDVTISFSGYDPFWTSILTMNSRPFRKAIYLHNDMYAEYKMKYPQLERMFHLYRYADVLVSVSEETNENNRAHLSSWLNLASNKFVACENMQDPKRIRALASEPVETCDEGLFNGRQVFINVSRLSPEKGHAKLIRAFARVRASHAEARLLILGLGPLKDDLIRLIRQLELSECVHILGFRSNPYAYMRRADCFVLSSDHEGQPMTLLEALILDVPIIATDIVGNRSVLAKWPELLVENSESGLVKGMERFIAGVVSSAHFDYGAYQHTAMSHFSKRVLGRLERSVLLADGG